MSQVTSVTLKLLMRYVIPSFRREVDKICALLRRYVEYDGNTLPTSRNTKLLDLLKCD